MTTKRILGAFGALLIAVLVLGVGVAAADDPQSGTWKMNAAKSKFSPGPPLKDFTVKIEADQNGIKLESQWKNEDGSSSHAQYEAKFDGKDYPATGLSSGADAVSVKRVNASTTVSSQKKAGQVVVTVTSVVSKDGKTRTSTWRGKNAQGHQVHNVVVFDKQ